MTLPHKCTVRDTGEHRLNSVAAAKPLIAGNLSDCLHGLYDVWRQEGHSASAELSTRPVYYDNLDCVIEIIFDPVKGFRVRNMEIKDSVSGQSRNYRFVNNHQVPGANSLQGLFPKPKPWDRLLKGKFRP